MLPTRNAAAVNFALLFLPTFFISIQSFSINIKGIYPDWRDPEPAYTRHDVPIGMKRFAEVIQHYSTKNWIWDNGGGMAIWVKGTQEFVNVQVDGNRKAMAVAEAQKKGINLDKAQEMDVIMASPTAVQKEKLHPNDIYVMEYTDEENLAQIYKDFKMPADGDRYFLNKSRNDVDEKGNGVPSATLNLLLRANLEKLQKPKFSAKYFVSTVHTHSTNANALTMHMGPNELLEFANQEMIQAIENRKTGKYFQNNHKIAIPVITSKLDEGQLLEPMMDALWANPEASAVIVHRHGLFVWGQNSWQETKQMVEAYEYLLQLEVLMRSIEMQNNFMKYLFKLGILQVEHNGEVRQTYEEYRKYLNASGHAKPEHLHRDNLQPDVERRLLALMTANSGQAANRLAIVPASNGHEAQETAEENKDGHKAKEVIKRRRSSRLDANGQGGQDNNLPGMNKAMETRAAKRYKQRILVPAAGGQVSVM